MGMINELHDVNISLNQKLKDKQERENKKALQENYNREIRSNLESEFYKLFEKYETKEAYKVAILSKDYYIEKITSYIENIHQFYNGKDIFIYKQFDIVNDLQNNYFKILDKIKKEYEIIEKVTDEALIEQLKNYIMDRFDQAQNKSKCYNVMQEKYFIDYFIQDITEDQTDQKILYNNYFKVLNECKKYYNGYIIQEREQEKERRHNQRELEKIKRRDKLITKYLINEIIKGWK